MSMQTSGSPAFSDGIRRQINDLISRSDAYQLRELIRMIMDELDLREMQSAE